MSSYPWLARYLALVGPPDARGCWPWLGSTVLRSPVRYGRLGVAGRNLYAHRIAFFLFHGRWPRPLTRHACDNGLCVNPAHLLEGSQAQNNRDIVERGRHGQSAKTHCPHGHPYDEANTRWYQGRRFCRACSREHKRKHRA